MPVMSVRRRARQALVASTLAVCLIASCQDHDLGASIKPADDSPVLDRVHQAGLFFVGAGAGLILKPQLSKGQLALLAGADPDRQFRVVIAYGKDQQIHGMPCGCRGSSAHFAGWSGGLDRAKSGGALHGNSQGSESHE